MARLHVRHDETFFCSRSLLRPKSGYEKDPPKIVRAPWKKGTASGISAQREFVLSVIDCLSGRLLNQTRTIFTVFLRRHDRVFLFAFETNRIVLFFCLFSLRKAKYEKLGSFLRCQWREISRWSNFFPHKLFHSLQRNLQFRTMCRSRQ